MKNKYYLVECHRGHGVMVIPASSREEAIGAFRASTGCKHSVVASETASGY